MIKYSRIVARVRLAQILIWRCWDKASCELYRETRLHGSHGRSRAVVFSDYCRSGAGLALAGGLLLQVEHGAFSRDNRKQ